MNEWILSRWFKDVRSGWTGQGKGHRSPRLSRLQSRPYLQISFWRTKAHRNIFGTKDGIEPRAHECRKIKRRKSAFANDHRMNEFNGDMLGIGRVWTASKG